MLDCRTALGRGVRESSRVVADHLLFALQLNCLISAQIIIQQDENDVCQTVKQDEAFFALFVLQSSSSFLSFYI